MVFCCCARVDRYGVNFGTRRFGYGRIDGAFKPGVAKRKRANGKVVSRCITATALRSGVAQTQENRLNRSAKGGKPFFALLLSFNPVDVLYFQKRIRNFILYRTDIVIHIDRSKPVLRWQSHSYRAIAGLSNKSQGDLINAIVGLYINRIALLWSP